MGSFCDLPSEIVEKIMLWVPADSLVQYKSVNKFWYSLISTFINDPEFVAKHLLITKNQSSTSLFFRRPSPHDDTHLITYPLLTIIYDENNHFITVTEAFSIPLIRNERCKDMNRRYEVYHCDGLILLINDVGTMMLCNPALKEFMILPEPKNVKIEGPYPDIGFELDSINNDYKCVAIWRSVKYKVEVYTVGSDSWREINMSQGIMDAISNAVLCDGLCWGGVCFWFVAYGGVYENILSFNMNNEEFHLIDLPDVEDLALDSNYSLRLSVWNDSVVICLTRDDNIFIFTMDEAVAGVCSWTQYVQVGPLEKYYYELPFWKNDEILMKVWTDNRRVAQLVSCNIRNQKLRNVVCDLDRNVCDYSVCFYVKSLISIRRR